MASPFTWDKTKPASGDALNAYPALAQADKATLLAVLGTLVPSGSPTTGWRVYQNNDEIFITTNVATLNTSTLAITQDNVAAPSYAVAVSTANDNMVWYSAAAGGTTLLQLLVLTRAAFALGTNIGQFNPPSDNGATIGLNNKGFSKIYLRGTGGVIRFDDTTIMGATLKSGTNGGDIAISTASYTDVDGTNLAFTVTIPTGWKLYIVAQCTAQMPAANQTSFVALFDGGSELVEAQINDGANAFIIPISLTYVITGDGASHTVKLRAKGAGATTWHISNGSSCFPTMSFLLLPSN